jgi:hypothetical protein
MVVAAASDGADGRGESSWAKVEVVLYATRAMATEAKARLRVVGPDPALRAEQEATVEFLKCARVPR